MDIRRMTPQELRELCVGEPGVWRDFAGMIIPVIHSCLARSVAKADLDDECMIVLQQVFVGLRKWDPDGPQSILSFVSMKANSRRKRYIENHSRRPPDHSLDEMMEMGHDFPDEIEDFSVHTERVTRTEALKRTITQLNPCELKFLQLYEDEHSLAECARGAGYDASDYPPNIIRRIKRHLIALLNADPYFQEHPEELAGLNVPTVIERN